jgi:hypothetical protein
LTVPRDSLCLFETGLTIKVPLVGVLALVGLVLCTSTVSAQDVTELKPFVGKWRAYSSMGGVSIPIEIVVQRDGSYTSVLHTQPPRSTQGRLELVDGKFRFKSADGGAGAVSLTVDSEGKRVLKAVPDSHAASAEYREVK